MYIKPIHKRGNDGRGTMNDAQFIIHHSSFIVLFSLAMGAATCLAAAPTSRPADRLPVALYPQSQRAPTTAPAVQLPGPILPAPDARLRPRQAKPTTLPVVKPRSSETPPILVASPATTPRMPARRKLSVPTRPFPPLALPTPTMARGTGASSAASAMNLPPTTSATGAGFFPLLPPLIRVSEAIPSNIEDQQQDVALQPAAPDDDAPVRPAALPPRPPL